VFVTSYHSCTKEQTVDLIEAGFDPEILDSPDFVFNVLAEEWYTVTGPSSFELSLSCYDEQMKRMFYFNARRG
jgi:hypothetical protein